MSYETHIFCGGVMAGSLSQAPVARATVINFDDVVGSSDFFAPTDVSTHYSALGVTFSDPAGPAGAVVGRPRY
jgi:hypothetical protein